MGDHILERIKDLREMYVQRCLEGYDSCPGYGEDLFDELIRWIEFEAKVRDRLLVVCDSLSSYMNESEGIAGYHLNGEVEPWSCTGLPDEVEAAVTIARHEDEHGRMARLRANLAGEDR